MCKRIPATTWGLTAIIILICDPMVCWKIVLSGEKPSIQREKKTRERSARRGDKAPMWKTTAVNVLTKADWSRSALDGVVKLNAEWFEKLAQHDPNGFHEQLRCLKRLGKRSRVMDFLKMSPETAGLLAIADKPDELVEILDTDDVKRTLLMGLFARNVTRRDIASLTAALKENRDLVCRLIQRGLIGSEVLFVFPRKGPGASEYEKWLQDNLNTRLAGSDDDLATFVSFALFKGRDLLDRLNEDESFRIRFRNELWPKLVRVVDRNDQALEFYMDAPNLWRLLALERGETLLERRGMLAAALLFGPDAYPKKFQDRVIEILLAGNGVTFKALTEGKFRKEAMFRRLLERPLSGPVRAAALNKLFEQGSNYRPLLEKYNRLSDEVLKEEVGPPPEGMQTWLPYYTHYMIARKLWQGRDVTAGEWVEALFEAGIDAASFAFPLAKGGKIVTQSSEKLLTKGLRKELAHESVELGIKAARKKLSKEAVKQLTKAGMERQARKWAITHGFTELQGSYRSMSKVIDKATSIEITDPIRFFYKWSNLGRESYKRLTGLEARVFMRRDAKVFVRVDRLACDQAKQYLNGWMLDAAKNAADRVKDHKRDVDEDQNWRRHISAWWLLNTGDQVLAPKK